MPCEPADERVLERVGARGRDVGADDRAAGEGDLDPDGFWSVLMPPANHLRQDAVDGVGMDERDLQAEQPHSWALVDQLGAGGRRARASAAATSSTS